MKKMYQHGLKKWMLVGVVGLLLATTWVLAQTFPSRPMRWIVPYAPGGTTDMIARTFVEKMSKGLGQVVVVENRAGAATAIGAAAIARAEPDGYTLGSVDSGTLAVNPLVYQKLNYNAEKDFTLIGGLAKMPMMLVVGAHFPAKNLKEFIDIVRQSPDKMTSASASAGVGSPLHAALELFKQRTETRIVHVPYKGAAPALQDLISGQVDSMFVDLAPSLALIRSGHVRVLAVAASARLAALPDVPTMAEAGLVGFEAYAWQVLVAPANVSSEKVMLLNHQLQAAQNDPDIRKKFEDLGMVPLVMTPQATAAFVRAEQQRWADVIRVAGVQLQD